MDGEGPFCIILDREYFKIEVEGMGTDSSEIEALWPEHACIPIRKKSELESCGQTYKVFNGPRNMHDGWYAATLKLTCESC